MTQTAPGERSAPAKPPRENLIRATRDIALDRSEGDPMPTLVGHAAVFNQWTEINSVFEGQFMERFAPGAFDKTVKEQGAQMRVLFNHGHDPQIGDKVLGTIKTLRSDQIGLAYEVPLFDTSYNRDLIPGLEAGVYGASFRFRVMQEQFVMKPKPSQHNPAGLPERTVTEAQVREFGPVTFPAYPGASAGLRSLTDEFLFGRYIDDPERLAELIAAYKARTSFAVTTTAANDSNSGVTVTPDVEPGRSDDTTPPQEPEPSEATTHSTSRGLFWFVETPKHLKEK